MNVDTQWRMFKEDAKDEEAFKAIDPLDALNIFTEHLKDLDKKETEANNLRKIEIKKKSRQARDAFRVSNLAYQTCNLHTVYLLSMI